ncbi:MAG TPA: hypothetical protein VF766_16435 [Pyrinomonadaceae bacterium]
MKTGIRRFILRLVVGLLAFLLGVTAAWALGGFNPFRSSSGTGHYRYQRTESYSGGDIITTPAFDHPRYRKHGCRMRGELGEMPPPAPHADAPLPPSPPSLR